MRALLVVNEFATSTTPATRRTVTDLLRAELGVDVETTQGPGHGVELGRHAGEHGYDTVIALGGDGTVNEVATGLLGGQVALAPMPGAVAQAALPGDVSQAALRSAISLAALPGGNANVFARNMGYSPDPVAAARQLIEAAKAGRRTQVGVGHVDADGVHRYFLSNAGVGLDAAVMARMSARRSARQRAGSSRGRPTDLQYARMALAEYAWRTDRRAVPLVVDGHPAALSLVVNLSPWTYVGARAMNPAPRAGVADGLAVYAPQRLTAGSFAHLLAQIARGRDVAREGVYAAGDRPTVDLTADRPMWIQVDGEAVGQVTAATFRHMPAALSIVV